MPELLVLGKYHVESRSGPAIWLRCVIAGQANDDVSLPADLIPVVYLPGVSRQDLRAVEACPEELKPLAELQYRGVIWSQLNAKDWTILAFLKSEQGGLGLDVAQDSDTKRALQLAVGRLLDEDVAFLEGKRLERDFFNTLLSGRDPVKDLLSWLDAGDSFKSVRDEGEWSAFIEVCKSQFSFDPRKDGILGAAERLANRAGTWRPVWDRFCEAPKRYPDIPAQIRRCQPPAFDLLADISSAGGWPQWNESEENSLRTDLKSLQNQPAHQARKELLDLERRHGERRKLVWAELGEAPLAVALEHLAILASLTKNALAGGAVEDLAAGYQTTGWKADDGVVRALAEVGSQADVEAVTSAVRAVYLPWMEDSARYLQRTIEASSYPGGTIDTVMPAESADGDCVLFVDGLRFDTAKRLAAMLEQAGLEAGERPVWAALPSVTATGKAAVSPVMKRIAGADHSPDFEPCVAETGKSLKGGYHFKKLLTDDNWRVLGKADNGDGQGRAWCEFGDIDHEGHDRGWKLSKHIPAMLNEITDRIAALLDAGWKRVRVVTDHGWLLLPGGLPKTEMPSCLAESKWGRCAALKPGAVPEAQLYPWFWNPGQHFALADGVSCFKKGQDYAHGGLSLQECLTLQLTVTCPGGISPGERFELTDVVWKGLRCTVAIDGQTDGLLLDVRLAPADPDSSAAVSVKEFKQNGTASVVVEDEELEGRDAYLVVLGSTGELVQQVRTVIGGESE
jgi:hypothetical protein